MPSATAILSLGFAGWISYAVARLAAKAGVIGYNRWTLVAVPVHAMPKMPRGYRVEQIDFARLADIAIDAPRDEQARRFAQGLVCLAAYNAKDECVGVHWVGPGPFDELLVHVRFEVPEAAGWDAGLYVLPEHRLGRGFAALWAGTAEWLRNNGKSWSMSWIADYNLPSLLSHKRMQSEVVGHITALRCFQWQYMARGTPKLVRIDDDPPAVLRLGLPQSAKLGSN